VLLCCIAGQCIISVDVNHGVVIVVRYVLPFSAKKVKAQYFLVHREFLKQPYSHSVPHVENAKTSWHAANVVYNTRL